MNKATPTTPPAPLIDKRGGIKTHFPLIYKGDSRGLLLVICILFFVAFIPSAHAGTIIKFPAYLGLQNGLVGCCLPVVASAQAGAFDGSYTKAPDCSGNGRKRSITLRRIDVIINP